MIRKRLHDKKCSSKRIGYKDTIIGRGEKLNMHENLQ